MWQNLRKWGGPAVIRQGGNQRLLTHNARQFGGKMRQNNEDVELACMILQENKE